MITMETTRVMCFFFLVFLLFFFFFRGLREGDQMMIAMETTCVKLRFALGGGGWSYYEQLILYDNIQSVTVSSVCHFVMYIAPIL